MKIKLDCPLCHVHMETMIRYGEPNPQLFVCPLCGSTFTLGQNPKQREWIKQKLQEHTV